MATIQKVSRHYRALYTGPDGKRICRSLKTDDPKQARELATRLEKEAFMARRSRLTPDRARALVNEMLAFTGQDGIDTESTEDFFKRWLAGKRQTKALRSEVRYKSAVDVFLATLGDVAKRPLSAVLSRHVEVFRDALKAKKLSPSTIRLNVKVISGGFAYAVRQGIVSVNPAAAVELDDTEGQTKEPFSPEELDALLREAPTDWKTAILLGAYAGCRLSDAVKMRWDAVDFTSKTLRFKPQKTQRKGRELLVPIVPRLLAHLEGIAGDQTHGLLCPSLAGKSVAGKSGLSMAFGRLMKRAGIDQDSQKTVEDQARSVSKKSFHSLRHTFNSELLNAGVDERLRMTLSGHTTASNSRRYSHPKEDTLRAAVSKIDHGQRKE